MSHLNSNSVICICHIGWSHICSKLLLMSHTPACYIVITDRTECWPLLKSAHTTRSTVCFQNLVMWCQQISHGTFMFTNVNNLRHLSNIPALLLPSASNIYYHCYLLTAYFMLICKLTPHPLWEDSEPGWQLQHIALVCRQRSDWKRNKVNINRLIS